MNFNVNRQKRLATVKSEPSQTQTIEQKITAHADLYIMPYTDKSFVVMGDTINHSGALVNLGGIYNANLRVGQGWIFAKLRQASVEQYIETGEVNPYVYSKTDQEKYNQCKQSHTANTDEQLLRKIFKEFREAFDEDKDYTGHSIIEVIYQFEEKYLTSKKVEKDMETEGEDESDENEDENNESDEEEEQHKYKRLVQRQK